MEELEYAPEYSHAERVRLVLLGTTAGALVVGISQLWLFPWLREFAAMAHCRIVFGLPGQAVLFYGVFVGIPLLVAALVAAFFGRRGLKVLREGQLPPSGEKVLRRTRIVRGSKARVLGHVQLWAALPLLALALWGVSQASALVGQGRTQLQRCEPSPSSN